MMMFRFLATLEVSKLTAFLLCFEEGIKPLKHLCKIRCVEISVNGVLL